MLLPMVMAMVMVYWTDHNTDDGDGKDDDIKIHGDDKIIIQFSRLVIGAGMLGKETQSDEAQAQVGGKFISWNLAGILFIFV